MSQYHCNPALFFVTDLNRLITNPTIRTIPAGPAFARTGNTLDGDIITNITENPSIRHLVPLGKGERDWQPSLPTPL
jgi:hypothetical protein